MFGSPDPDTRLLQESSIKISFGIHLKSQDGFDFIDFNKTLFDCGGLFIKLSLIVTIVFYIIKF